MKDESLGTNVCTAAADADEGHSDLADLHDFAETYLLESHHETKEFEDEETGIREQDFRISRSQSPQQRAVEPNGLSIWNQDKDTERRDASSVMQSDALARPDAIMNKAVAEPMDSSDWDQTQERFGSQGGGQKGANTNSTESPESVLNTRSNGAPSTSEAQRLISNSDGGGALQQTDTFLPRHGSGSNLAVDTSQEQQPQSYSRLLGLEDELMGRNRGSRGEGLWEGRGSSGNIFHGQGFPGMANQGQPMQGGMSAGDNRNLSARNSWGSDEMGGGMDEGGWGSRNPGRSQSPGLSRMMSENIGHRYPNVANPRRQYSEDLYDAPRGSLNLLSGPGASPLDIMLGEADLGRPAQPQGDPRGHHMRSKSHGMPPQSPARPSGPYYSPPVPGTPADGTRKRRREAFHQIADQDRQPMSQHSRGGRMMQDDLIASLKQQIAGLEQHTKSLMKMTLYRISRNANATAEGVRESSQQNPRNAYLDKVVANFMYNRFSRSAGARPNYMASGEHIDSANYFGRSCSNPETTHSMANQGLDMEP